MRHLLPPAAIALLAVPSFAGQICSPQLATPLATPNWSSTIQVPRFDPALGNLQSVRLTFQGHVEGRARVENTTPSSALISLMIAARLEFTLPNQPVPTPVLAFDMRDATLAAFDGSIDFEGVSGLDWNSAGGDSSFIVVLGLGPALAAFTGPAHAPGTIGIPVTAAQASIATGPGALVTLFDTRAMGAVQVCYDYTQPVTYCAGDGNGLACPCGNSSVTAAQAGCVNSRGLAGRLRGIGATRLSQDLLVLTADGLPSAAPALLLQGTSANGGSGTWFGDGLRCTGGTEVRLGIVFAQNGTCTWPSAGSPALSVAGLVAAPGTRTYQVMYRDAPLYCTSATFNLTQGVEVGWLP